MMKLGNEVSKTLTEFMIRMFSWNNDNDHKASARYLGKYLAKKASCINTYCLESFQLTGHTLIPGGEYSSRSLIEGMEM